MPLPKRSSSPPSTSTTTTTSSSPASKKSCTRADDPDWTKSALEAIRVGKQLKNKQIDKLRDMKARIEQAERELAMLNDMRDQILLQDPVAQIRELVVDLCRVYSRDRKRPMVEDKMSEAIEEMKALEREG
ncbi:uncharacterized protein LDX57_002394 [Aspergillus melleus]|uniref:uncharacterized protein n=1 Tax=Aspergillus melleus TaxID=138277 RepID=UPI001E8EEC99|nr:uncharacterized protein LDX57_002394 [Aspergillus melleus]KAH8424650.1 hypothetical protein LDX57_002394 [Aspergillus melleus]